MGVGQLDVWTAGRIERCGETITQSSMVREAGGRNPGGKIRRRLAGRCWEWGDKTLRESRNLIVTEKEESLPTRLQPQAVGDLRMGLLGSWALKGPVYSECSEGVQPQKVRCSLMLAVAGLSWRSNQSLFRLPSGCVGLCQAVGGGRKEPGWLQPLGPTAPS